VSIRDEHMNLVVLAGRVAADPEVRELDSGARLLRLLVTVKREEPTRRIDVVPVTYWDPPQSLVDHPPRRRESVWLTGELQRRYWESPDGRRSRLELVAHRITVGRSRQIDEPERSMGPEMGL
jgi:single-stranded DNA-binding protein